MTVAFHLSLTVTSSPNPFPEIGFTMKALSGLILVFLIAAAFASPLAYRTYGVASRDTDWTPYENVKARSDGIEFPKRDLPKVDWTEEYVEPDLDELGNI